MKHVDNERDFFDDVLRHVESHGLVEHRTGRGVLYRRLLLADLLTSAHHRRLHECICTEERTQTQRSTDRGARDSGYSGEGGGAVVPVFDQSMREEREWSGKRSGACRKRGERSGVRTFQKTLERERSGGGAMGVAADFEVGYKTGFASRASEKKLLYPHFSKCGVQASKYQ